MDDMRPPAVEADRDSFEATALSVDAWSAKDGRSEDCRSRSEWSNTGSSVLESGCSRTGKVRAVRSGDGRSDEGGCSYDDGRSGLGRSDFGRSGGERSDPEQAVNWHLCTLPGRFLVRERERESLVHETQKLQDGRGL